MKPDDLRERFQRLRADLMASNKAITAIVSSMQPEQHARVIERFAQLSVMNSDVVDQLPTPPAPDTLQAMRAAEERMHTLLQSAKAMPPGG